MTKQDERLASPSTSGSAETFVACAATGHGPEGAVVADQFGRCDGFVVASLSDESERKWVENTSKESAHGAGTSATKLLAALGVASVIGPRFGPKAAAALRTGGLSAHVADPGLPVERALAALRAGELKEARDDD